MECNSCGNQNAYRLRFTSAGSCCNVCGDLNHVTVHDVYFKEPYLDPNLVHPERPHEKNGVWVTSRAHKARLMAEQNLREAGDRRHGTINFDPKLHSRILEQGWPR